MVHGPNEAGKTTFFDALFQALCRPSETKLMGKALKKRYGAGRKAEVELAGPFDMGEDEFLNLCAIRAGDLELDMAKDSPWMAKLKTGLFHGGLDPAALAAEFERRSSDGRPTSIAGSWRGCGRRPPRSAGTWICDAGNATPCWPGRRAWPRASAAWRKPAGYGRPRRPNGRRRRPALAFEEKIDRRRRADEALADLDRRYALEARLRELEAYREDRREEWEALAAASREASAKAQADKARRDLQDEQSAKARAAQRTLEEAGAFHAERSRLAGEVAAGMRALQASSPVTASAALAILAALAPLVAGAALAYSASGLFASGSLRISPWPPASCLP